MKHLILMNPVRRRKARRSSGRRKLYGAALKAHQRRVGGGRRRRSTRRVVTSHRRVRRRVRRNPVVRSRSRSHSPAMRAKIGRAVRAANRRRGGGGSAVVRHTTTSVRRRFSGGGGGMNLSNPFKQLFSRQTLTIAAGAVSSSFITQFVLTRYGAQLPMANQTIGRVAYKLLIPVAGAMAVKRFNRDLASGMLIGGAVMAMNELIAAYGPKGSAVAAVGGYAQEYDGDIGAGGMPSALSDGDDAMGEYFNGEADFATATYEGDNPFDSAPAFKNEF